MDEHRHNPDDDLERLLGAALRDADPVPARLHDAALAAFAFRDPDAALAELVVGLTASVRDTRSDPLVFAADDLEIALEVDGRRCRGQLAPPGPWPARIEAPGGAGMPFLADELGQFSVEVPTGPIRLVVDGPTGLVRTEWFTT